MAAGLGKTAGSADSFGVLGRVGSELGENAGDWASQVNGAVKQVGDVKPSGATAGGIERSSSRASTSSSDTVSTTIKRKPLPEESPVLGKGDDLAPISPVASKETDIDWFNGGGSLNGTPSIRGLDDLPPPPYPGSREGSIIDAPSGAGNQSWFSRTGDWLGTQGGRAMDWFGNHNPLSKSGTKGTDDLPPAYNNKDFTGYYGADKKVPLGGEKGDGAGDVAAGAKKEHSWYSPKANPKTWAFLGGGAVVGGLVGTGVGVENEKNKRGRESAEEQLKNKNAKEEQTPKGLEATNPTQDPTQNPQKQMPPIMAGGPQQAGAMTPQQQQQIMSDVMQGLQQGVSPEELMQILTQQGIPPEMAQGIIQQAMQMLQGGGGGGGMPSATVPGVQFTEQDPWSTGFLSNVARQSGLF